MGFTEAVIANAVAVPHKGIARAWPGFCGILFFFFLIIFVGFFLIQASVVPFAKAADSAT